MDAGLFTTQPGYTSVMGRTSTFAKSVSGIDYHWVGSASKGALNTNLNASQFISDVIWGREGMGAFAVSTDTPVPLPATLFLLATGLGGLGILKRGRGKTKTV